MTSSRAMFVALWLPASGLVRPAPCVPRARALASASTSALVDAVGEAWALEPATDRFAMTLMNESPPLIRVGGFLSEDECERVIRAACGDDAEECTEYLNHRVNVDDGGELDEPSGYDEEQARVALEWSAGATSGRRVRATGEALDLVGPKVLELLGLSHRKIRVAEELYFRPDRATVIVRDATVVHYQANEGVAPHVDGKDATVLIYLNTVDGDGGGRTVFPEHGLAFPPSKGDALVYDSRDDLLHFAEPVADGREKWVMQLLIDHRLPPGSENAPLVDWETGLVIPG